MDTLNAEGLDFSRGDSCHISVTLCHAIADVSWSRHGSPNSLSMQCVLRPPLVSPVLGGAVEALSSWQPEERPHAQLALLRDHEQPLERYDDYEGGPGELRAESLLAEKFGAGPCTLLGGLGSVWSLNAEEPGIWGLYSWALMSLSPVSSVSLQCA